MDGFEFEEDDDKMEIPLNIKHTVMNDLTIFMVYIGIHLIHIIKL